MKSGIDMENRDLNTMSPWTEKKILTKQSLNQALAKKPPCSPSKNLHIQAKNCFSPSPVKPRSSSNKENFLEISPAESPFCPEISLFGSFPSIIKQLKEPEIATVSTRNFSQKVVKRALTRSVVSKKAPRISQVKSKLNPNHSFKSPQKHSVALSYFTTPESYKPLIRVFTPVLTEKKKKKIPETLQVCKRISLFHQEKSFLTTSTSFKDQSTRIEDSTTIGEITPVKNEDLAIEYFQDESFCSPLRTIKVYHSPENVSIPEQEFGTPDNKPIITPEMTEKKAKTKQPKAPRKGIMEFTSPDSDFFSLSSSSEQEVLSEVSILEEIPPSFGDISSMYGKTLILCQTDKEMQTDNNLTEIIGLLHDQQVIDGLKLIGKFSDLFKLINK